MLYNRWQPKTFGDVLGQEETSNVFIGQIINNVLAHSIILTGIQGTGKTTFARIIGMAANCHTPLSGEPCGECPSCKAALAGKHPDIKEINAAKNNGVDSVRAIDSEVNVLPVNKMKVYIFDEAHMLSTSAFNALLKTMEEPPAHVVFIICTTEMHKIPATIVSRCQFYNLKRIDVDTIMNRLNEIIVSEGYGVPEDDVLRFIATAADGSMRNAISMFEGLVVDKNVSLSLRDVEKKLGMIGSQLKLQMMKLYFNKDIGGLISKIDEFYTHGINIHQLIITTLDCLSDALKLKVGNSINGTKEYSEALGDMVKPISKTYLLSLVDVLSKINYPQVKKTQLELVILKIGNATLNSEAADSDVMKQIVELKEQIAKFGDTGLVSTPVEDANVMKQFNEAIEAVEDVKNQQVMLEKLYNGLLESVVAVLEQKSDMKDDIPVIESEIDEKDVAFMESLNEPFAFNVPTQMIVSSGSDNDFYVSIDSQHKEAVMRSETTIVVDESYEVNDSETFVVSEIAEGVAEEECDESYQNIVCEDAGTRGESIVTFTRESPDEEIKQDGNSKSSTHYDMGLQRRTIEEAVEYLQKDARFRPLLSSKAVELAEDSNGIIHIYAKADCVIGTINTILSTRQVFNFFKTTPIKVDKH